MNELHEIDSRCLDLFRDVDPAQVGQFLAGSRRIDVEAGGILFTPFDASGYLYLLLAGTVKTFVVSVSGREQITHLFFPGDVFGGLLFGTNQDPQPWGKAVDAARVIALDEEDFRRLMRTAPTLCINIFNYMVVHHHEDLRRLQTMIHNKASHRLLLTLMYLGDRQGDVDQDRFTLDVGLTHEDLGNMIGVVRSTVSELLSAFRQKAIVSGKRRKLTVDRLAARRLLEEG